MDKYGLKVTCSGLSDETVLGTVPHKTKLSPGLKITDNRSPVLMTGQIFFSPDKPRFWPVK